MSRHRIARSGPDQVCARREVYSQRSRQHVDAAAKPLKEFNGIGAAGADIVVREVQDVWPWVRPYFDQRAIDATRGLGLPTDPERLGALAPRSNARLAAALVRCRSTTTCAYVSPVDRTAPHGVEQTRRS